MDEAFINETSPSDAAYQELMRDHVESTDFIRQQRQQTLLQHQQMIKQTLREKRRNRKVRNRALWDRLDN